MAGGTLLGIEAVERDGEHAVALDADAVDHFKRLAIGWGVSLGCVIRIVGIAHK
jgi:hypothetical protein